MTDQKQIPIEEALKLVDFVYDDTTDEWQVLRVHSTINGDVWGDVRGDVWGSIWGNIYGTINGLEWQFIFPLKNVLKKY